MARIRVVNIPKVCFAPDLIQLKIYLTDPAQHYMQHIKYSMLALHCSAIFLRGSLGSEGRRGWFKTVVYGLSVAMALKSYSYSLVI